MRKRIQLWTVTVLTLAVTPCVHSAPRRPHVLVIHTDQHRFDCVGACGNRQIKTPHLDSLAADGVRFSNSFCAFPVCTPSRYSLLSGLPVNVHRGWDNHCTLPPGTLTFASLLRQAGYATKAIGKMHFTPTYLDVGFDELELAEQNGPGRWDDDYHRYLRDLDLFDANDLEDQLNDYRKEARPDYWKTFGALPSNLNEQNHSTTWIGGRAVDTLQKWSAAQPALLMVGFIKPHHPFDPPEPWARMYDPDSINLLPGWTAQIPLQDLALNRGFFPHNDLSETAVRRCTALYYATISQIDHQVGRMIQILKSKGLYDETLIIFTSDHGEYLGFHHMLLKGNHMYDPLAKVPLIIKYPHQTAAGTVDDSLVSGVDVAPTILKVARLPVPAAMKGLNLADAGRNRQIAFSETRQHVMARTKNRKLIFNRVKPAQSLFFNLEGDPFELSNLYNDPAYKTEIAALVLAAESWRPVKLPDAYVDENAPRINRLNVPPVRDAHRDEIAAWYARKIQQWRALTNQVPKR